MKERQRQRWLFPLVLVSGIAAFGAFWYASASDSEGTQAAFGGTYVEGVTGAPARVNPLFAGQNEADESLVALIFSGLTRLDDRGQPFPDLAQSWEVSPDGLSYTFRLRSGIVWQDGHAFDAEDVIFTYGLLKSPALRSPPPLSRVLADATVTRLDAATLRIDVQQPYAPLLAYLSFGILPRHVLGQTPVQDLFDASFNLRPLGTGPFKLEVLDQDRAVLAPNPAYHLGQPYIQRFEMRFFRDDGA
jgi:peptide/nickel transport system substrate-binding protein